MSDAELVAEWFARGGEPCTAEVFGWMAEHIWHPEIEWRAIQGAPDDVGTMVGRERLLRYYGEWLELFEDIRNEVREQHQVGDQVVLVVRVTARSKSTGMPLELNYALVAEVEDGLIRRGREYATAEQAFAAARSAVSGSS
jgi:ketosteroid isomerase-like protein